MRRYLPIIIIFVMMCLPGTSIDAVEKKTRAPQVTGLESDNLVIEGKELDNQIIELNRKLQDVITRYKLMSVKNIRVMPFRISYTLTDSYMEFVQHEYKRNKFVDDKVYGIKEKRVRIYVSGNNISRIESTLTDKDLGIEGGEIVKIVDPSPSSGGTDDIVFTHTLNNTVLIANRNLGEVKNNRVFPVRNNIKREFLLPHSIFIYETILKIAEMNDGEIEFIDGDMAEYLKKETAY